MWREAVGIAAHLAQEPDPLDVAAEVANMGAKNAAEIAFFAFEIWALCHPPGAGDPLACSVDAAERWLLMIDQLMDGGKISSRTRDIHHDAWCRASGDER